MKLIDRQIEATEKTLEFVIAEHCHGKIEHCWDIASCYLCKEFKVCKDCPMAFDGDDFQFCYRFLKKTGGFEASLEDIAGFLMSLLVSLKEMK